MRVSIDTLILLARAGDSDALTAAGYLDANRDAEAHAVYYADGAVLFGAGRPGVDRFVPTHGMDFGRATGPRVTQHVRRR